MPRHAPSFFPTAPAESASEPRESKRTICWRKRDAKQKRKTKSAAPVKRVENEVKATSGPKKAQMG